MEVVFNPSASRVDFLNTTTKATESLRIRLQPEDQLHLCVGLLFQGNEVEFLGEAE